MPFLPSGDDGFHAVLVGYVATAYVAFVASGALPSERVPGRRTPVRVLVDRVGFAAVLCVLPAATFHLVGRPLPGGEVLALGVPSVWAAPTLGLSLVAGVIAYFAPKSRADRACYPQYLPARWSGAHLALEIGSWAIYLFAYEAVFRGFLLHLLLPAGMGTAVVAQTALYAFAHFPKSQKETQGSLFFGLIASAMTLGWGTLWPAFLVHLALALGNDAACARLLGRTDEAVRDD